MRFMDEMLEKVKGGERAMLQLQYSEVAGKIGDTDKETEMIQEARRFFAADAENGHPVAAFYIDLIDQKLAGKPFPDAAEMQEKLQAFVDKLRSAHARAQETAVSEAEDSDSEEEVQASMIDDQASMRVSSVSMENADDILRKMAALANNQQSPIITFSSGDDDDSEDEDAEDGEESSDDNDDASEDSSDKGAE